MNALRWSAFARIGFLVAGLIYPIVATVAETPEVAVRVQVLDFDDRPVSQASVKVRISGDATEPLSPNSNGYAGKMNRMHLCGQRSFEIIVAAGEYLKRSIAARVQRVCTDDYSYNVFLSKPVNSFDVSYVNGAFSILSESDAADVSDRALAYLEPGYQQYLRRPDRTNNTYTCRLQEYYAAALQRTCKTIGYDTCDKAIRVYTGLRENAACTGLLRRSARYYETAIADIRGNQAKDAFASHKYSDSAHIWDEIQREVDAGKVDGKAIRITNDFVLAQAGTAYLRLGLEIERTSPAQATAAFSTALERYQQVERPSHIVQGGIDLAKTKVQ